MKRKMLTAFLTAAMITSLTPAMAFAAPAQDGDVQVQEAGDTDTETEADTLDGDTEDASVPTTTEKTDAPEETKTDEKVTPQNDEPATQAITDEASLRQAIIDAAAGDTIDCGKADITLTSVLQIGKNITLSNVTLRGNDTVAGNLVTTLGNTITLENVTIITGSSNKNALHAYGTKLTANNLKIDHRASADGAPIIVNNGAYAEFTGSLDLTLSPSSWYGVNVDDATAIFDFADIKISTQLGATQSVVCCESDWSISGLDEYTRVVTEDGQSAYVADSNLLAFISAKADKDVSLVELNHDITLIEPLYIREGLNLSGNGYTISGSEALGLENVVTVLSDDVLIGKLTIKTNAANKSALHIYKADAILNNVTLDNQETAGGAGMIVNGGTATVYGTLDILLGANSWGGINVDTTTGPAGVTFKDGSKVSMTGGQNKEAIYVDDEDLTNGNAVTITGAEAAGLEKAADGSYVLATEKPAPGDGGQGTGNGQQNQNGNNANAANTNGKNVTKAARTGDSNSLFGGAAALLGSGAVAAAVLRKRRGLAE